ncbi:MAG TPA: hypothetical protein VHL34_08475 [Rhizomicrobium sp.]|jgi:hypothetical protein|nr:hypothetical protein [Rhizomicrobium sp.]
MADSTYNAFSEKPFDHVAAGREHARRLSKRAMIRGCSFLQMRGQVLTDIETFGGSLDHTETLLSSPRHEDARFLHNIWRTASRRGGFRVGQDIPCRALAPLLAHLVVYEPIRGGADFRARAAGSALLRRYGYDISGFGLSQLLERESFERHRGDLAAMIRLGLPCAIDVQIAARGHLVMHFEVVTYPVLAPDSETPWLLSGTFYHDWPPKSGRQAQLAPDLYGMAIC